MSISKCFEIFCESIRVKNKEEISTKYTAITKALNNHFWDTQSEYAHCLQVGSYGRKTGISGISDLDMVFELPDDVYERYNAYQNNGQSALLQEVKRVLCERYPRTTGIKGDGQVVVINFKKMRVEVLPSFRQLDNSYLHPDSNNGGSWEWTNPRPEIAVVVEMDRDSNGNYRKLCRMVKAWRNNVGLKMGGWLIDTLCYKFFEVNPEYKKYDLAAYAEMCSAFFIYLAGQKEDQDYWMSPGSNQRVYKSRNFVPRAKKAAKKALLAIETEDESSASELWNEIFGRKFPIIGQMQKAIEAAAVYRNTEEFIEDRYEVDIQNYVKIECEVTQEGYRPAFLSKMPFLKINKSLRFFILSTDAEEPFEVKWKVRNVGAIAIKKDCIRGQILDDKGKHTLRESSNFGGPHYVECYIIKDEICVAKDRIGVQIDE